MWSDATIFFFERFDLIDKLDSSQSFNTLYFFIDAAFMVCRLHGIDQDVLAKTQKCDGDMLLLLRILNQKFEKTILPEISKLPQKLDWRLEVISNDPEGEDTFYKALKDIEG